MSAWGVVLLGLKALMVVVAMLAFFLAALFLFSAAGSPSRRRKR